MPSNRPRSTLAICLTHWSMIQVYWNFLFSPCGTWEFLPGGGGGGGFPWGIFPARYLSYEEFINGKVIIQIYILNGTDPVLYSIGPDTDPKCMSFCWYC